MYAYALMYICMYVHDGLRLFLGGLGCGTCFHYMFGVDKNATWQSDKHLFFNFRKFSPV